MAAPAIAVRTESATRTLVEALFPLDTKHTHELIKNMFKSDKEEVASRDDFPQILTVSLMCPIGKERIKMACRSIFCKHIQCFDASAYVQANWHEPLWLCPICGRRTPYSHLVIDTYMTEVLAGAPESEEAIIKPDCSWVKPEVFYAELSDQLNDLTEQEINLALYEYEYLQQPSCSKVQPCSLESGEQKEGDSSDETTKSELRQSSSQEPKETDPSLNKDNVPEVKTTMAVKSEPVESSSQELEETVPDPSLNQDFANGSTPKTDLVAANLLELMSKSLSTSGIPETSLNQASSSASCGKSIPLIDWSAIATMPAAFSKNLPSTSQTASTAAGSTDLTVAAKNNSTPNLNQNKGNIADASSDSIIDLTMDTSSVTLNGSSGDTIIDLTESTGANRDPIVVDLSDDDTPGLSISQPNEGWLRAPGNNSGKSASTTVD